MYAMPFTSWQLIKCACICLFECLSSNELRLCTRTLGVLAAEAAEELNFRVRLGACRSVRLARRVELGMELPAQQCLEGDTDCALRVDVTQR